MPENYLFTITFDNFKSFKTKTKLINNLYTFFNKHIDINGELLYTVEYHKKSDKKTNNYFRPHVHGILYSVNHIKKSQVICLVDDIKRTYGRIVQFALQEDLDEVNGWRIYMMKDVADNEQHTRLPHYFKYVMYKKTPHELLECQQLDEDDVLTDDSFLEI